MRREELIVLIGYGCVSLVVTSLIESVVYGRALRLSLGKALQLSGLVNLASAVGCIPLGILVGGSEHELVPLAAYWRWSTVALVVGACVIETLVARWQLRDRPIHSLAMPVVSANAASYGLYLLLKAVL